MGEELPVTVTVRNSGIFSCLRVQAVVHCRDLLTGEETRSTARFPVSGKSEAQALCDFHPPRCGKLALTLSELRVFDLFGLVGAKKPVELSAPSLVLPDIWPVELSVSERQSPDMDSDEYSMYHPGDDPSETFALREYLSGDRIKNIHWKLSEKTDHLMVRQLGLPVNNSIRWCWTTAPTPRPPPLSGRRWVRQWSPCPPRCARRDCPIRRRGWIARPWSRSCAPSAAWRS